MSKPKISIITITFNSEKTLERTINSILDQEYENLEYIIIDGGSQDGTLEIVKKYQKNIDYFISEMDQGISDAFNKGIKQATGEIIGIINSDDGLCSDALATLAKAYEDDVDVYRGNVMLWHEDTSRKIMEIPSLHFSNIPIMVNVSHQSTFIKRKAYDKYGMYNIEYKNAMDLDLLMRFERAGAKFKYVDAPLAYFTFGGVTFSQFSISRKKELQRIVSANGASFLETLLYGILIDMKHVVKKVVNKDKLLVIRHGRKNIMNR
ncbi:glycosyltransferase [Sporolactobacillus sp. CQH2019]|uniref:glycosyltransferase family 2 protein n=1 Tax=Sporolactobacillus sp. CQH2019 TaxID=3023512 RepID=UPI002368CFDF|nr:glycosyltransferase [Sporolactobacillus sp. CQH2019]MDD9148842.1 glycosyltransferase [Sporolactobacillus sp. CQH2019]